MSKKNFLTRRGFTLIEVIVVITIIGILFSLVGLRVGAFQYWKEEGFIRKISQVMEFVHRQAIADQTFYVIEINLREETYRVGVVRADSGVNANVASTDEDVGALSLELADFMTPVMDSSSTLIPPPSFPSLYEPQKLPPNAFFQDIKTIDGEISGNEDRSVYLTYNPRGFSEFAVVHIKLGSGSPLTLFANPYTGIVEITREYKDYEWKGIQTDQK